MNCYIIIRALIPDVPVDETDEEERKAIMSKVKLKESEELPLREYNIRRDIRRAQRMEILATSKKETLKMEMLKRLLRDLTVLVDNDTITPLDIKEVCFSKIDECRLVANNKRKRIEEDYTIEEEDDEEEDSLLVECVECKKIKDNRCFKVVRKVKKKDGQIDTRTYYYRTCNSCTRKKYS